MLRYPASALGGPPVAPKDFKYPSEKEFSEGLVWAFDGIEDHWAAENLTPPVGATVPMTKAILSSAAEIDYGALADLARTGKMTPAAVDAITGAINAALEGTLDFIQAVSGDAIPAVAEASQAMPLLGAVVSVIVDGIVAAITSEARMEVQREKKGHDLHMDILHPWCDSMLQQHRPYGTGPGQSVTPADFFRRVAYHYQGTAGPPLDGAMLYVLMCGGQARDAQGLAGFGIEREKYEAIVAEARARNPKIGDGIPVDAQRKMWRCIRGIMTTVRDPIASPTRTDQGRALMPILQDTLRRYWLKVREGDGPGWDHYLAQRLSDHITSQYDRELEWKPGGGAGGAVTRFVYGTCAGQDEFYPGRHVDLSGPFYDSIAAYDSALRAAFWDPGSGKWRVSPKAGMGMPEKGKTGALVMSNAQISQLKDGIVKVTGERTTSERVAVMIASAMAGYGAYWLSRRYKIGA